MGILPGKGNGNPLQYSCLENPMSREAWHTHVLPHSSSHLSRLASCSSNPFPPPHSCCTTSLSSACTPKGCCFTLHTPLMTPVLIIVIFPLKKNQVQQLLTLLGLFLHSSFETVVSSTTFQYNEIAIQTMIENLLISEAVLGIED